MHQNRQWCKIGPVISLLSVLGIATPSRANMNSGLLQEDLSSEEAPEPRDLEEVRTQLLAAATAYNVALLVEADLANYSENVDDFVIARLVDEELPIGRENAEKWVSSLDESALRLAGIIRADQCLSPKHGCKDPEFCTFNGKRAGCLVTSCGDGACKACWDVFGDLRKLAVKGWCAYTCQQGAPVVGIKLVLQIRLFGEMSACLPLSTPVP